MLSKQEYNEVIGEVAVDLYESLPKNDSHDVPPEDLYDAVSDAVYALDWFARAGIDAETYFRIGVYALDNPHVELSDADLAAAFDLPTPREMFRAIATDLVEAALVARIRMIPVEKEMTM